ncbi:hypothetical protein AB0F11_03990 [Streptomyces sp. NPDC032472]|uniref:hypothetical protein n=1 Tax=Streptomyces sp. NPDC032472 TaxID=3155018 RepID=UPI0033CF9DC5
MRNERHDEPLSDEELELFLQYLHRYAIHDVDQWQNLRVGSEEFPVYVTLSRKPPPGAEPSAYARP